MCYLLYAGTEKPMARREWTIDAPDLSVCPVEGSQKSVENHFSKPEIQYIGSTSACGCDFPCVMFQNGGWPWFEDGSADPEVEANKRYNREALVALLEASGERAVELYCLWDGDFAEPPLSREEIHLSAIVRPDFRFKERGFYIVKVQPKDLAPK